MLKFYVPGAGRRFVARGLVVAAAAGGFAAADLSSSDPATAPKAEAATVTTLPSYTRARAFSIARTKLGAPYRYGAAGPYRFDCSGLTMWSYSKVGRKLPRSANQQSRALRKISRPQVGDLIFFYRGGRAYHVGFYAGNGNYLHAPKPGDRVKISPLKYRHNYRFARP